MCDTIKKLVQSNSVHQNAIACITNQFIQSVINYYSFKILDNSA